MENVLVGKYFIIYEGDSEIPTGRARIVDHIFGPYYLVSSLDLFDKEELSIIINIDNLQDAPIFSSIPELEKFSHDIPLKKSNKEVSH